MALDTTIGGAAAEAYVSAADADTYHVKHNNAAWASLTDPVKEASLRKATQYIDSNYLFVGVKQTKDQSLQWPRSWAMLFGYAIPVGTLPRQLTDACAELALKASASDLQPDLSPQLVTEETVGPLTTRYSERQRDGGRTAFDVVTTLLQPLLAGGGSRSSVPVIRA